MLANPKPCAAAGCSTLEKARGLCAKHYQRYMRHGTTEPYRPSEIERFWAKVDKRGPGECWEWQGGKRGRYGFFNTPPTTTPAHRYAYAAVNGPIPRGRYIDHKCHNPSCVNPAHLQAVTPAENNQNHSGPTRANKSGVRGVWWDAKDKSWAVQVGHRGKVHSGGRHKDLTSAEQAAIALRNKLHTNNLLDRRRDDARSLT